MRWQTGAGILAWFSGVALAARIDPTAVQLYVTLSIFVLILRNLGDRRTGLSAYSVFNPNCMPLLGQLQAHQFENEIRHRPLQHDTPDQHRPNQRTAPRTPLTPADHDALLAEMRAEIQTNARRARRPAPNVNAMRPGARPRR